MPMVTADPVALSDELLEAPAVPAKVDTAATVRTAAQSTPLEKALPLVPPDRLIALGLSTASSLGIRG